MTNKEEQILHELLIRLFEQENGPSNVNFCSDTVSWKENLRYMPHSNRYYLFYNKLNNSTGAIFYQCS